MLYDLETQYTELLQKLASLEEGNEETYTIVCYCAAWCRTCQTFEKQFQPLASQHPEHIWVWVDVEEQEDLLIDEDLENFPTVLVQNKKGSVFYGPLPPFSEHIERVLKQAQSQTNYLADIPSFEQLLTAAQ